MKIAIVKLSAMGDIIHAMVALQYLKKTKPDIQIDWIVEEGFAQVLEHNPDINKILTVNLKALKNNKLEIFSEIKKIRSYAKNHYDLVIDAQGLLKSAITSKLLGKKVVGFSKNSIREGVASYFYSETVEIAYQENAIERNVKILGEPLGITINQEDILNKQPFLFFATEEHPSFYAENYIVFVVGASVNNKIYPKKKFLEVAKRLNETTVVVWGNTQEKETALYLESQLENIIAAPKLNLNQLKSLIANAKLLIGGDTGPTHMAWALNVPSVTIFGNTPEQRNTYLTPINRVVKSKSEVDPLNLDKEDFSIKKISTHKVILLAKELLNA
jgi:heptosyltransferase-1